jgi:putative DNA primase/helicase
MTAPRSIKIVVPPDPGADPDTASDLEFFGRTVELHGAQAEAVRRIAEGTQAVVGIAADVERLACLSPIQYDRVRQSEAVRLNVRVTTLDSEVAKLRAEEGDAGHGRPFEIDTPEPWPDPVDGAWLLNELAATFRRYVVLPEHGDTIAALWTLHTYAFEFGHITPILVIASPDKGCGKTTMRDVLAQVVRSALSTDGISASALFRVIEKWRPSVLLDDFDSWGRENEELRGVLNTGYRRGGVYVRCVGDDSEPRGFVTYAPKAINLIGRLHPTLHDRAIVITMRRKLRGEAVESLHDFDGEELRRRCARWVADNAACLQGLKPLMPEGLFNRQADNWRPLLALADVAGGDWPDRARQAALAVIASDTDDSLGVMLLADIRATFDARGLDRITTEGLIEALTGMDERPWVEFSHGKPLTSRALSRLLKPFEIRPGTIRLHDGRTPKGYMREWFEDAFARYIPEESATPPQSNETRGLREYLSATGAKNVADEKCEKSLENKTCGGVADKNPRTGRVRV